MSWSFVRLVGFAGCIGGSVACGGPLSSFLWSVELTSPLNESSRVEFCPVAAEGGEGGEAAEPTFLPTTALTVSLRVDKDDIHTFENLQSNNSALAAGDFTGQVFGTSMSFDISPVGIVYDDSAPATLTVGGNETTRRFVSGSTSGSTQAELSYDLEPNCPREINTPNGPCTCETTRFTWKFTGQD